MEHKGKQRLRADGILILTAIIWGSSFAAQRVAAAEIGYFIYNGLRFLVGALTVLMIAWFQKDTFRFSFTPLEWLGGCLGALLILGGSNFQQAGLMYTTAGKAGFITGLYVVVVPILLVLWSVWLRISHPKETLPPHLHWSVWAASLLAAWGLYLLSAAETLTMNQGDLIVLAGTTFWALHILLISSLAPKVNTLRLAFIQYLVCGGINTILGLLFEANTLPGLSTAWWSILYVGIFSVGIAYTLQVEGQKIAPHTDAAIILSLEAVFAAFFGWIFLQEGLSPIQFGGCVLIFAGMLLAQAPNFKNKTA